MRLSKLKHTNPNNTSGTATGLPFARLRVWVGVVHCDALALPQSALTSRHTVLPGAQRVLRNTGAETTFIELKVNTGSLDLAELGWSLHTLLM